MFLCPTTYLSPLRPKPAAIHSNIFLSLSNLPQSLPLIHDSSPHFTPLAFPPSHPLPAPTSTIAEFLGTDCPTLHQIVLRIRQQANHPQILLRMRDQRLCRRRKQTWHYRCECAFTSLHLPSASPLLLCIYLFQCLGSDVHVLPSLLSTR